MKRRGFLGVLGALPIAARVVLRDALPVTEHGITLPSSALALPAAEPIVLATSMPPVTVEPIEGFLRSADFSMHRDVQPYYSGWGNGPAGYISGLVDARLELQVTSANLPEVQWRAMQSGKPIRIYIEAD